MQIYRGVNALSDFRKQNLLTALQAVEASITDISAEYIHFVDTAALLSPDEDRKLAQLLTYDSSYEGRNSGQLLLVVPRAGTISPWSSKATDIIHNAGLSKVKRAERGIAYYIQATKVVDSAKTAHILYDRMIETVLDKMADGRTLFTEAQPRPYREVNILKGGKKSLQTANTEFGLALSADEIDYLAKAYKSIKRNPTDAELMMFAQVNSEHCRHKIFNADWTINGKAQPKSLFKMIRNTHDNYSENILSAYSDNAAVLRGATANRLFVDPNSHSYQYLQEPAHLVIKVETHNHPTAIAPFPGAATGSGGEIRDEGATGRGAKPKMGLSGFTVSNLQIPGFKQPWEEDHGKPDRIVSALDIMLDGPLGGAAYANEFGRPNLLGYFRTFEQLINNELWGYHKPIMIAGGLGNIRDQHVQKGKLPVGAKIIVLGGPAMLIGLGGGAASSMHTGQSEENLDFASVQRANAEIERRAQEVINACTALGDDNPIISIHDVGAGGLSNALPELVHDAGLGARFELRDMPNAEPGLSPMEIWCNEAQERYVLGINETAVATFTAICERERCPFAVVGTTTAQEQLTVTDRYFNNHPIDLPMSVLFGKPPKMSRRVKRQKSAVSAFNANGIKFDDAAKRVLQLPAVGSKQFLITIGDRTVGGLTVRDQMVGPWQVPVSDVAVTASSYGSQTGEAMSMGERPALALIDAPASGRMAIGEAITNILAAPIEKLADIKLSANWMAAAGYGQEDEKLFDTVRAIGEDFCPALNLTIPVGKDSLSMRTVWEDQAVTSPLSLVITAFAPVTDTTSVLTPELQTTEPSVLLYADLGQGKNRLGGSALAQVFNQQGNEAPDADPRVLKTFFDTINRLRAEGKILAYHDRSDGGLFATLCEMAFAARCGLNIDLSGLPGADLDVLFNEELGAVLQVRAADAEATQKALGEYVHIIGAPAKHTDLVFSRSGKEVYRRSRAELQSWWAETSYRIQKLRDNPAGADSEYQAIADDADPGLSAKLTFDTVDTAYEARPKVAIFREQGVNGQMEMAAAFKRAGFEAVDIHLNDLLNGKTDLADFRGLVACGGFSYGDVLGAGEGWAKTILFHDQLRQIFKTFFERPDTFTLGVCNGCQMLSALKELIPGAQDWPRFLKNRSERFEARVVMAEVKKSPSIFFTGMEGSRLPIPVAHGEGRASFETADKQMQAMGASLVALQYIDNYGQATETYPFNPNGSPQGITALTTPDGRATIIMPHPERAFLTQQYSWHPNNWGSNGPWFKLFQNARAWTEEH